MSVAADPARRRARELVAALEEREPDLLRLAGADLAPALEQQLFFAIRDGRVPPRGLLRRAGTGVAAIARPALAAGIGSFAWRLPSPGARPLVVLVREPTHYPVLLQVERELQAIAGESLAIVRVGRAATASPAQVVAPRLEELMAPQLAGELLAHRRAVASRLPIGAEAWSGVVGTARADQLRRLAAAELERIALGTAGLVSVVRRWRPAVLAAFDEVGTWARILPAVGASAGIPTLDLPHAEAADAAAVAGLAYDRLAVYGESAAAVLALAGVPRERIVEIGAPRFDPLVVAMRGREPPLRLEPILFAAQYLAGAMSAAGLADCYRAALAVAAELAPAELVVVPHPAEPPGTVAGLVAEHAAAPGVSVRLADRHALHEELASAGLLVTGWSNAVLEAAVAGVPAITIDPGGVAPVDFAADGLALSAGDGEAAAAAARRLRDGRTRRAAVARSRAALGARIGPLDGRASERAARLLLSLAGGAPRERAA